MSALAELCPVAVERGEDLAVRRTVLMTRLYELRVHLAEVADGLSRSGDLLASLEAFKAHESILAAVDRMEKQHPELT